MIPPETTRKITALELEIRRLRARALRLGVPATAAALERAMAAAVREAGAPPAAAERGGPPAPDLTSRS